MEISALLVDASGSLITGGSASSSLKIRRVSDGFLLDWSDLSFKSVGWSVLSTPLMEVDSTYLPGLYNKLVTVTSWLNGFYQSTVNYDDGITVLNFMGNQYIQGGQEIDTINNPLGPGATAWIYRLTDNTTGLPIPDADVWVTSDLAGDSVLASGRTDRYGNVTFYLDGGVVYVWSQKSGYNFTNPDTEVVT